MPLKRSEVLFPVTLYYDGECPLCIREINWLSSLNRKNKLIFTNIKSSDFSIKNPDLSPDKLDRVIHARLGDGRLVTGVDATVAAWEAVGKGWVLTPLTWPVLSLVAGICYQAFAANRHKISVLFSKGKHGECKNCRKG